MATDGGNAGRMPHSMPDRGHEASSAATPFLHNDREAFRIRLILRGHSPARVRAILAWGYLFGGVV